MWFKVILDDKLNLHIFLDLYRKKLKLLKNITKIEKKSL